MAGTFQIYSRMKLNKYFNQEQIMVSETTIGIINMSAKLIDCPRFRKENMFIFCSSKNLENKLFCENLDKFQ